MRYKLVVLILASMMSFSQTTNTIVKAKIEIEQGEGDIKITGTAENLTEFVQSFSYKLSIIKKAVLEINPIRLRKVCSPQNRAKAKNYLLLRSI